MMIIVAPLHSSHSDTIAYPHHHTILLRHYLTHYASLLYEMS